MPSSSPAPVLAYMFRDASQEIEGSIIGWQLEEQAGMVGRRFRCATKDGLPIFSHD